MAFTKVGRQNISVWIPSWVLAKNLPRPPQAASCRTSFDLEACQEHPKTEKKDDSNELSLTREIIKFPVSAATQLSAAYIKCTPCG